MKIQEFGEQGSNIVLIQPVDDHDLAVIESEVEAMEELSENPFHLITVKVDSWNNDLSPWKAPIVSAKAMLYTENELKENHILKKAGKIKWQNDFIINCTFTRYESKNELRITGFSRDVGGSQVYPVPGVQ